MYFTVKRLTGYSLPFLNKATLIHQIFIDLTNIKHTPEERTAPNPQVCAMIIEVLRVYKT
jgi:hypothetical protein